MPLKIPENADKTPTRPHVPAEVVHGDYDVLKRALDATEAHVIHLHGEVVGLEAENMRLRGLIEGLHCVTSTHPLGKDCIEVKAGPRPNWKECQVCRTKERARNER